MINKNKIITKDIKMFDVILMTFEFICIDKNQFM
jgi:hypothetical protein